MAYQYPYDKIIVADDDDYVVAAHHNKQENQVFELTEAVKALDDFKGEFPDLSGAGDKLVAVKSDETGYEYVYPGLLEPGVMAYFDPEYYDQWETFGFHPSDEVLLITTRILTENEILRLLIQRDDMGTPTLIDPAILDGPYAFGDTFIYPHYFDLGGDLLIQPYGVTGYIMAHVGIYDIVASAWVDMMSIFVFVGGAP